MHAALSKLLKVGKAVEIPAPPPFSHSTEDAHNWSISVTAKYVSEVLELQKCAEQFRNSEVTGLKFICMEENDTAPIVLENSLHKVKLTSHAEQLRKKVLEKAFLLCPSNVREWSVVHLAAWMTYKIECPKVGMNILRARLHGKMLLDYTDEDIIKVCEGNHREKDKSFSSLKKIVLDNSMNKTKQSEVDQIVSAESNNDKKESNSTAIKGKKKTKTALAMRRDLAKSASDLQKQQEIVCDDTEDELIVIKPQNEPISVSAKVKVDPVKTTDELIPHISTGDQDANNNYHSDNNDAGLKKRSKKKGKKKARKAMNDDSDDDEALAATNQHILESLQGKIPPPAAPTSISLNDTYSNSHERKQFLDTISTLRKTAQEHTQHMNHLQAMADKLRRENEYFQAEQKSLFLEKSTSKNAIANLVHDRNVAMKELASVTNMYQQQSRHEQIALQKEIHRLMNEKEQLAHDNNVLEVSNVHSRNEVLNSAAGLTPIAESSHTQPVHINVNTMTPGNAISAYTNAVVPVKSSSQSAKHLNAKVVENGDSDLEDEVLHPQNISESKRQLQLTQSVPSSQLSVNVSTSLSPTKLSGKSPLMMATQSLNSTLQSNVVPPNSQAIDGVDAPTNTSQSSLLKDISLMAMVEDSAQTEKDIWLRLIATYSYPKSTGNSLIHIEDTRTLLNKIAILWVRLGLRMLRDVQMSDTDSDSGLTKALKGLEKCARSSIQQSGKSTNVSGGTNKSMDSPLSSSSSLQQSSKLNTSGSVTKSFSLHTKSHNASHHSSASTCCSSTRNEYCVAVGMVFGLALAQYRVLNKYPSNEEKTNLLFLLNKMNYGELPLTELSRENLRDFLHSSLGVNLKWDRFDSVCQKIDIEKKGFMSTNSMLRAFQSLTPLYDKIHSQSHAQFACLFLLTASIQSFAAKGHNMSTSFLNIISGNVHSSPSFTKFLTKEKECLTVSKYAVLTGTGRDVTRSTGPGEDIKILEEQLMVSDLMYELSKDIATEMEMTGNIDWKLVNNTKKQKTLEHHTLAIQSNSSYRIPLEFAITHHQDVCTAVSKTCQVYEGAEKELLNSLATLFITFLTFRRACVKYMLSELIESTTASATMSLSSSKKSGSEFKNNKASIHTLLDKISLKSILKDIETSILTLSDSNIQETESILKGADAIHIAQFESMMCELLGIPVPCDCCLSHTTSSNDGVSNTVRASKSASGGLIHNQCLVEAAIHRSREYISLCNEVLGQQQTSERKAYATSQSLKDIQQELHESLWTEGRDDLLNSHGSDQSTPGKNKIFKLMSMRHNSSEYDPTDTTTSNIQVVEEMNGIMYKQRIEQTSRYLEYLNARAARKKKIILSLMNLWKSAKVAMGHRNNVSNFSTTAEELQHMRLYAMPTEDILSQTRQVQNVLITDMQKDGNNTKTSQLVDRVALLRRGIESNTIDDRDGAIVTALREIAVLEQSLLQANGDAMKLASKIISNLEK